MTMIPVLPTPPQSTDPVNFAPRADAWMLALTGFSAAANAQANENNAFAIATANSAAMATAAAASARSASELAVSSANAGRFDQNATYAANALVWSPVSGLIYRRLSSGKFSADPSADKANWVEVMNLPFGAAANQAPSVQHLGLLAFMDALSVSAVRRNVPDSQPGDVWREYVSDTTTTIKFHGFDGVIRSRTESWT